MDRSSTRTLHVVGCRNHTAQSCAMALCIDGLMDVSHSQILYADLCTKERINIKDVDQLSLQIACAEHNHLGEHHWLTTVTETFAIDCNRVLVA